MKRPPLISSIVAACIAMSAGDRLNTLMIPVPILMRLVLSAISVNRENTSYPQTSGSQKESYPSRSARTAALTYFFRS